MGRVSYNTNRGDFGRIPSRSQPASKGWLCHGLAGALSELGVGDVEEYGRIANAYEREVGMCLFTCPLNVSLFDIKD
jgi:hypothetical protein